MIYILDVTLITFVNYSETLTVNQTEELWFS